MTLEDETGIANTIMWVRTYEAYRPVVLGARFIAVTGQLQNEHGVIHIVAEHFEDLTPLLRNLSVAPEETLPRVDHINQGGMPDARGRHPRSGDSLVRLLREHPALAGSVLGTHAEVLPKGRNFH
jgi:error-prone DNA polymerase